MITDEIAIKTIFKNSFDWRILRFFWSQLKFENFSKISFSAIAPQILIFDPNLFCKTARY